MPARSEARTGMSYQRVCALADVPKGSVIAREVDGTPVALVH
jgi:hypothetical protein